MKKILLATFAVLALSACTQTGKAPAIPEADPSVSSTEVLADGKVAFRVFAPLADSVSMSGDLAERVPAQMTKGENGYWEVVMDGIEPGVYRYYFNIDGVKTLDPVSEQAIETYSLLKYAPEGDEFFALKDVPHGAVAERYYHSDAAGSIRRCHVWTPAGFEKMTAKLPVFYLIHGGGDTDMGWPTLGAAGLILDNLYAEGKISPMIVVMPDGHIAEDVFVNDLCDDLVPFIESTYNVYADPAHRALSGLSQGGIQTLRVITDRNEMFDSYVVLSSGWFKDRTDEFNEKAEKVKAVADSFNKHVKLFIFTEGGPEDIAYENGQATMQVFKDNGINFEYTEGPGGHTWYTWRYNLRDIAPRLFK